MGSHHHQVVRQEGPGFPDGLDVDTARDNSKDFGDFLLSIRRFAIFAIMVMAYLYYRALGNAQLAAIGLLSFAALAQLAPACLCQSNVGAPLRDLGG
mgnify:CR=1 FL=1